MYNSSKRHSLRSRVWEDTTATITLSVPYAQKGRQTYQVKGIVENISATGMFLKTSDYTTISGTGDIIINFDPASHSPELILEATGKVVRRGKNGIGICFTSIDVAKLRHCIIQRINQPDTPPPLNLCRMAG